MAFNEIENDVWTESDTSVVVSNFVDASIDGSSKKIVWTDAENEYVTISFDAVDLSEWQELTMYVFMRDQMTDGSIFRITIDGNNYDFSREHLIPGKWNFLVFNCANMGDVSSIVITCLVENLTLIVDYIGYRKVAYDMDVDIINALKNHINLDYDYSTILSANVAAGAVEISISDTLSEFITDTSILEIDNGSGTTEIVELNSRSGELSDSIVNSFLAGAEVRVLCPIRGEDYDSMEPDPICGIKVYDIAVDKQDTIMVAKNGVKLKQYLGSLGILIYIDCNSKKKLDQLVREFNFKYGKEFQFFLDGEKVDIYLESSLFSDSAIGNNPRMAYYYRLDPQPYLLVDFGYIDDLTLTVESGGIE